MTAALRRREKETFGELNRGRRLRKSQTVRFDAAGANLAAQCDGLDLGGPTKRAAALGRLPLVRPRRGRLKEYTTDRCRNNALHQAVVSEGDPQPQRSGVQHLEVAAEDAGQRLDNYLHRRLNGVPRSRIYRVIRKGEVRVNGRRAGPETRLAAEDKVRIPPLRLAEAPAPRRPSADLLARIERAIIHEDERLLVVDKPAGVAVHGGSGVSFGVIEALRALRPEESLELVHRLDRDTSGLLLVARRGSVLRTLHALLREEGLEKRYLTLLKGQWNLGS